VQHVRPRRGGLTLLETDETLPLPSESDADHEALTASRDG
jgi:hypothetical protein